MTNENEKLSEAVKLAADLLGGLTSKLRNLEDVEAKTVSAKVILEELQKKQVAIAAEIESARQAGVTAATQAKLELTELTSKKAFELDAHERAMKAKRAELEKLDGEVRAKQALHDQIGASISSLRKQFAA